MTDKYSQSKIIVGSGWWSNNEKNEWNIGDDYSRSPSFFELWYYLVKKYLNPARIVVTDSCSPLLPDLKGKENVEWIMLDKNYGHANDIRTGKIKTKYCGFTRSIFVGATYALACDADYYVYIEQDCVIHGEGFLGAIMTGMEHPILIGQPTTGGRGLLPGGKAAPMLQQSLVLVRKDGLERFICGIYSASETDGEFSPEIKMERDLKPFGLIPIPYGRSRPIDFTKPNFYAQHLTKEELNTMLELEGFTSKNG